MEDWWFGTDRDNAGNTNITFNWDRLGNAIKHRIIEPVALFIDERDPSSPNYAGNISEQQRLKNLERKDRLIRIAKGEEHPTMSEIVLKGLSDGFNVGLWAQGPIKSLSPVSFERTAGLASGPEGTNSLLAWLDDPEFYKYFRPKKYNTFKNLEAVLKFKAVHPEYEYVDPEDIISLERSLDDGLHVFRGVRKSSIPYSEFNTKPSYGTYDLLPEGFVTKSDKGLPVMVSDKPMGYTTPGSVREIHIQPKSDFTYVQDVAPRKWSLHSIGPEAKLHYKFVNSKGFDLDKGHHFLYIPAVGKYARMQPGMDTSPAFVSSYESPLINFLNNKYTKLGLIGTGVGASAAGIIYAGTNM